VNPPGQYADDRNLRARQRLWRYQDPYFDIVAWVLDLAGLSPGLRVLDAGCGNGQYLHALARRPVHATGCDRSMGMLRTAVHPALLNADVAALPVRAGAFDVVLAVHMLYHVPDRVAAVHELRRVLAPGGVCIAVTNGARHTRSLRALVERAVRGAAPGWRMHSAAQAFTAENAAAQLAVAFDSISGPGGLTYVALSNCWIIINVGGGPTDDKPAVTLEAPRDPDGVSSFLNIRVKDIEGVYAEWSARGAQFLTPPKQHQFEKRCYIRDPDGHLIEVGQTTDPEGDWSPAHWPSSTPAEESG
jgi:SAM-dependent methyltransferase